MYNSNRWCVSFFLTTMTRVRKRKEEREKEQRAKCDGYCISDFTCVRIFFYLWWTLGTRNYCRKGLGYIGFALMKTKRGCCTHLRLPYYLRESTSFIIHKGCVCPINLTLFIELLLEFHVLSPFTNVQPISFIRIYIHSKPFNYSKLCIPISQIHWGVELRWDETIQIQKAK